MLMLVSIVVALAVFGGWMSIVGNPHVVETVIGLVFGAIAGGWTYVKGRKVSRHLAQRRDSKP